MHGMQHVPVVHMAGDGCRCGRMLPSICVAGAMPGALWSLTSGCSSTSRLACSRPARNSMHFSVLQLTPSSSLMAVVSSSNAMAHAQCRSVTICCENTSCIACSKNEQISPR